MKRLSKTKAERIIGAQISLTTDNTSVTVCTTAPDGTLISTTGKSEYEALKKLINEHYRYVSRLVAQQQAYRCANCGSLAPLHIHHKLHRSRGRIDAIHNLEALCYNCHEIAHKSRHYRDHPLRPYPNQKEPIPS